MKIGSKSSKPAKAEKTSFFCTACGNEQPRWFGHCPACGEWNTASEAPSSRGSKVEASKPLGSNKRWLPAGAQRAQGPVPLAEGRRSSPPSARAPA